MSTKTLRLVLFLLLTNYLSVMSQFSGGSGTEEDPYKISTLTDLKELSLGTPYWSDHFIITQDIDATETNTWENESGAVVGFSPIGTGVNNEFKGVFNGQNHTISNLYINNTNTAGEIGLFGRVGSYYDNSVIKNLNLENVDITGVKYVGGLAGKVENGVFSNVHVSGTVDATNRNYVRVGMVAGYLKGAIDNSTSSGTVTGADYTGGLIGETMSHSDYEWEVFKCSSSASVIATYTYGSYAGGLIGKNGGSIKSCYATGDVSGVKYVGGLTSYMSNSSGFISNSFATGTVTSTSGYAGGFIGNYTSGTIEKCYSLGGVESTSTTYVGAFIGQYPGYAPNKKLFNNFYNSDAGSNPEEEGITALPLVSFSNESSFVEWNFQEDWEMAVNSDVSTHSLPYPKPLLYDFQVSTNQTIASAGTISGDLGWFNNGDEITITASEANSPYVFAGWYNGDEKITDDRILIATVTGDVLYTAKYKAEYSGGEGTKEAPYKISTLNDLSLLVDTEEDFGKYFILTNDIDASETSTWVDDEDANVKGFTPIGNFFSTAFSGNFDGQGYTVSNLYIDQITGSQLGLFGYARFATIQNLKLTACSIKGVDKIGALVGESYGSVIENCTVEGIIEGISAVGGLVGYFAEGYNSELKINIGSIINSSTKGKVIASAINAGGLVGQVNNGRIERCYSEATIDGYDGAGGLIGASKGYLIYNYATGNVSGRINVGGLLGSCGSNSSLTLYCFATGDVSQEDIEGSEDEYGLVGGFVGGSGIYANVTHCYATGKVYGIKQVGGFYGDLIPGSGYPTKFTGCVYDSETTEQADQQREGVFALTTEQFANIDDYPEDWGVEWEIATLEEFDDNERSYQKILTGYDYQVYNEVENDLAGTVSSDKGDGWFKDGDEITLTATTDLGYEFDGWYKKGVEEDTKVSSEATYTFVASEFATYIAKHTGAELNFAGGTGSPLNPYKISTLEHLILLGNRIVDLQKHHFVLINDIDASESENLNNGAGFKPIGTKVGNSTKNFEGKLDGADYKITDLFINNDANQTGIFKDLAGEVVNLTIENCTISGIDVVGSICGKLSGKGQIHRSAVVGGVITGNNLVGGLLGQAFTSTFQRQAVTYCSVDGTEVNGVRSVGGLAGSLKCDLTSSMANATVNGEENVGGLIGDLLSNYGSSAFKVVNCYSISKVTGNQTVGGLVGYVLTYGKIYKSYAIADVTVVDAGEENHGNVAGGLVGGATYADIANCYAVGSVTALDYAGGLFGAATNRTKIVDSYAAVKVNAAGMTTAGFIGSIDASTVSITESYFDTEISGYEKAVALDQSSVTDITGLSTSNMSLDASFTALDLDGTWEVVVNTDIDEFARPYLKWETNSSEVIVATDEKAKVTVNGEGWYNLGDEVKLSVITIPGWKVAEWKVGDEVVATTSEYTFNVEEDGNYNITVNITEDFSAAGEGTEEMPYQITNLSQLEELSNIHTIWDKHFILMNDIDASETQSWNVADHDNNLETPEAAMGYSPIGDDEGFGNRHKVPFSGTFDGQGFTISNIYINRPVDNNLGLFGFLKGASISNISIDNADILGKVQIGGLAGVTFFNDDKEEDFKTVITNCHVKNSKFFGESYVGGFASNLYYVDVDNSSVENIDITSIDHVGGFVAEVSYESTIEECYATGKIETYGEYTGGFVARSTGSSLITNSHATVNIEGYERVGGFVAFINTNSTIKHCYASGNVKAHGYNGIVGGFIGYANRGQMEDCYATGDVTSIDIWAGGFVGYGDPRANPIITKSYATGNVKGRRYIGGFAGEYSGQVSYSYSTGMVDGSVEGDDTHVDFDERFGGFCGYIGYNAHVDNCFTLSNVKGFNYTGGFAGASLGYVNGVYSVGTVESDGNFVGGFAGYVHDSERTTVLAAYFDKTTSGKSVGIAAGVMEGVAALETADFAEEVNMPELLFGSVWSIEMEEGLDANSRPYLKWNYADDQLNVSVKDGISAQTTGAGWYNDGDAISLEVKNMQPGIAFSHWEVDGANVSTKNPYEFTYEAGGHLAYEAVLKEDITIAEGEGTEESPYVISTFDELVCLTNVSSIWDKYFVLGGDIDAVGSYTVNDNYGLSPIGVDVDNRFTGHFDGKGYTISNLFISRYNSINAQGLFAHVGDAESDVTIIKNVNLSEVLVGGAYGVGSLVGDMVNAEITNCTADGLVLGTQSYIGGLVGRSMEDSNIKESSYRGSVYSPSALDQTSVGGLVGYSHNTLIDHCYAFTDSIVSGGEAVGGLVGYSHDESAEAKYGLTNSFAVSDMVKAAGFYIGGLVGINSSAKVDECYAVVNIMSLNSLPSYMGGLIGDNGNATIENSYYNSEREGALNNGLGTPITTEQFADLTIFSNWTFGSENKWKMATGKGGEVRPCFYEMDTYTVTYKAGKNGMISLEGADDPVEEIVDEVIFGVDSRKVTAVANEEHRFVKWSIENEGTWDVDNETTFVPAEHAKDFVLVAEFESNDVSVDSNSNNSIKAYPNPAKDVLYIDGLTMGTSISIVDVTGNKVYADFDFNGRSINISGLNPGVYVIIAETLSGKHKIKVVKQ